MDINISKKLPRAKLSLLAQIKFLFKLFDIGFSQDGQFKQNFMKKTIFTTSALVVVAFLATSVFAYTSPTVTARDNLFVLKRAGENIKVAFASDIDKVRAYMDIAKRRLAEVEYLSSGQSSSLAFNLIGVAYADDDETLTPEEEEISDTLELMEEATENSMDAIEEIEDVDDMEEAANLVESVQVDGEDALDMILDKKSKEGRQAFREKLAIKLDEFRANKDRLKDARSEIASGRKENMHNKRIDIKTMREEIASTTKEDLQVKFTNTQDELDLWKDEVLASTTDVEKIEELFSRIDDKMLKVEEAIDSDNIAQALGLLRAVNALKNNARHFVDDKEIKSKLKNIGAEFHEKMRIIHDDFMDDKGELRVKFEALKRLREETKIDFKDEFKEMKSGDEDIEKPSKDQIKQFRDRYMEIRDGLRGQGDALKDEAKAFNRARMDSIIELRQATKEARESMKTQENRKEKDKE